MPTYTAALEALDAKRGYVHTVADWHRIRDKAAHAPADLTDDDLVVLEGFGGAKDAAAARARRDQARAAEDAQVPAPRTSPAAPAPPAAIGVTAERLAECFKIYSTDVIVPALKPIVEKHKALEQRNQALEARVLELEASIASQKVEAR